MEAPAVQLVLMEEKEKTPKGFQSLSRQPGIDV